MRKWGISIVVVLVVIGVIGAIGANPRYIEELRIGGGHGDAADGGADFEKDGTISTDGSLTVDGDVAAGANEATDHSVSVMAGTANDAFFDLYEADTTHGGAMWFDGSAGIFGIGTRDGSSTVTNALTVSRGSADVTVEGDLAVDGGTITTSQTTLALDPTGVGRLHISGNLGTLNLYRDEIDNSAMNFRMWNSANASTLYGTLYCTITDSTAGSEEGEFSLALMSNGSVAYNRLVIDGTGKGTFKGDLDVDGGDVVAGTNSGTRGVVTAWDGSGGSAPGALKIGSPNGTVWYLFVEDDGTLKVHSALPTQNSDGSVVGTQF